MTYGINGSCLLKAIRAVLNEQNEHGFWYLKKQVLFYKNKNMLQRMTPRLRLTATCFMIEKILSPE